MAMAKSRLSKVFELSPAGPNWPHGVLYLDVTLVPLVIFWTIGHQEYLLSALFGAQFTMMIDPGGSAGDRAARGAVFGLLGAGVTALAFGLGAAAWGWLVLAASLVTLLAGLNVMFGPRRFVAANLLNVWFIVALALASGSHRAHSTSYTWAQVLAWAGGSALWVAATFVAWLIRGRQDRPRPWPELPGDTTRQKLTGPVITFAVIRAIAIAVTVTIAFGLNLAYGYWMPVAAIIAMQADLDQTTLVAMQRLSGTLIGAAAATLLLLLPAHAHGQQLVALSHGFQVVALVLLMHATAVQFWNYALYTAAVSAAVLILDDISHPSQLAAAGDRVLWTLCGVGIAVVVTFLATLLDRRTAEAPT